jgi:hypothetical protein
MSERGKKLTWPSARYRPNKAKRVRVMRARHGPAPSTRKPHSTRSSPRFFRKLNIDKTKRKRLDRESCSQIQLVGRPQKDINPHSAQLSPSEHQQSERASERALPTVAYRFARRNILSAKAVTIGGWDVVPCLPVPGRRGK